MAIALLPHDVRARYEAYEWKHACTILHGDFSKEWADLVEVLRGFKLLQEDIVEPGGRKSRIAAKMDEHFYRLGWKEKEFDTRMVVDDEVHQSPTHKVDCYKNRVAIEIEWNNKDPFYDRDLNNFRLLFDLRAVSVGVIITRSDELQEIFDDLGRGSSYGASTTHMGKLVPRIEGGGGGGCPVLVLGITKRAYVPSN